MLKNYITGDCRRYQLLTTYTTQDTRPRENVQYLDTIIEKGYSYLLHSLIFPVSSSSSLLCLLESLILSIFWKPFLQKESIFIETTTILRL